MALHAQRITPAWRKFRRIYNPCPPRPARSRIPRATLDRFLQARPVRNVTAVAALASNSPMRKKGRPIFVFCPNFRRLRVAGMAIQARRSCRGGQRHFLRALALRLHVPNTARPAARLRIEIDRQFERETIVTKRECLPAVTGPDKILKLSYAV